MEQNIKELKSRKKQLEAEIRESEKEKIISMIEDSGKSIEEIKEFLAN